MVLTGPWQTWEDQKVGPLGQSVQAEWRATRFLRGNCPLTLHVNVHHHNLAARKIMAALYCRRVRAHTMTHSISCFSSNLTFFFPRAVLGACAVPSSQAPLTSSRRGYSQTSFAKNMPASAPS